jgi:NtrC-family two-component system response regulator AlgB
MSHSPVKLTKKAVPGEILRSPRRVDASEPAISPMRILIIDDEPNIRKTLRLALAASGMLVDEAANGQEALRLLERASFDLAFLDLRLGQESGLDLLERLALGAPRIAVVIVTAYASIDSAVDAMRRGAFDYLPKPFTPGQIRAVLERVGRHRSMQNRLTALEDRMRREFPEVALDVGDERVEQVLAQARKVAATEAIVLLRGESGTGKGVLAHAIHAWSERRTGPFVNISCPSLTADLLESVLFGHARGAFTGAVSDTEGKIAAAEGGTLFLDEIGDLPLPIQPKLLRFLQERKYERVGETRTRTSDVRLIAASNRDLDAAVAAGEFRDDLLFRLNVVELTLPPLRERSDRLALADHLLSFFALRLGKKMEGFTDEARQSILEYAWPGNLRELRNAIERAVIFAAPPLVDRGDLPIRVARPANPDTSGRDAAIEVGQPVTLLQLENEHIRLILERTSSREEAARILGVDPSTLYRKRRLLGL